MTTLARAISYTIKINVDPFRILAMFAGAVFLVEFAVAFASELGFF